MMDTKVFLDILQHQVQAGHQEQDQRGGEDAAIIMVLISDSAIPRNMRPISPTDPNGMAGITTRGCR